MFMKQLKLDRARTTSSPQSCKTPLPRSLLLRRLCLRPRVCVCGAACPSLPLPFGRLSLSLLLHGALPFGHGALNRPPLVSRKRARSNARQLTTRASLSAHRRLFTCVVPSPTDHRATSFLHRAPPHGTPENHLHSPFTNNFLALHHIWLAQFPSLYLL